MRLWKVWVLLLAILATGCKEYDSIDRPQVVQAQLENVSAITHSTTASLVSKEPVLIVVPYPHGTALVLCESLDSPKEAVGDHLSAAIGGTEWDSAVKVATLSDANVALALRRTAHVTGGLLVNSVKLDSIAARFPRHRLFLAVFDRERPVIDGPLLLKPLDGFKYAEVGSTNATVTVSIPSAPWRWLLAVAILAVCPIIAILTVALGWVVTLPFKTSESKRRAYAWIVYPLSATSIFLIFPAVLLFRGETESFARFLVPGFRLETALLELIPFGLPIVAVLGEFLLLPPRPGSSKIAAWFRAGHRMRHVWIGMALGILCGATFRSSSSSPPMLFLLLIQVIGLPMALLRSKEGAEPALAWQPSVDRMASFFGVPAPTVLRDQSKLSVLRRNAAAFESKQVVVGAKLAMACSEPELEFLLAHEVAHFKYFPQRKPRSQVVIFGLSFAFTLLLMLALNLPTAVLAWAAGLALTTSILLAVTIGERAGKRSRDRELTVDADALTFTRDLPSALSALEKLHVGNRQKRNWGASHPILKDRLENLRRRAAELSLETDANIPAEATDPTFSKD